MCKKIDSIKRAAFALDNMFNILNEKCFENKLSKAQVVAERVKGAYGAFWVRKQYKDLRENWTWKIAINPCHFDKHIEFVAAVLLHEMCHQYAAENSIQDCSRGGTYHNQRYRDIALSTGLLNVEKDDRYGWMDTTPNDKMVELCIEHEWQDFEIIEGYNPFISVTTENGQTPVESSDPPKTKQSTRKHVCPNCGAIARTTKDIPLICGLCNVDMVQEVK